MIEKENMKEGIIKGFQYVNVINNNIKRYYVLGGLKTQKEELKRNYEGRNHKKEFNKWLW